MSITRRAVAEFLGTFRLVQVGCGSALLAAKFLADNPNINMDIGFLGRALAFGVTMLTVAHAIGHISGCHLNPAVAFGLFTGGRFPALDFAADWIAQVIGGIAGAAMLRVIAGGAPGFSMSGGFACNGYAAHFSGHYLLAACFLAEVVLTFFFLLIILGSADKRAPSGFAPQSPSASA